MSRPATPAPADESGGRDRGGFLADVESRGAIAGSSAFIAFGVLVGSPGLWDTSLAARLVSITVALVVMHVILAAAGRAAGMRTHSLTWAAGAIAAASLAFALALGRMYQLLGVDPEPGWSVLVPTSAILCSTALAVAGAQARALREHRERLASLTDELVQLGAADDELTRTRTQWQAQARAQVTDAVESALEGLPSDDWQACALAFRHLADDVVRPMSHDLAQAHGFQRRADISTARPSRRELLGLVARSPVPPGAFSVAMLALSVALGLALFGPLPALALSASTAVCALATAALCSKALHRTGGWPPSTRLLATIACLALGGLASIGIDLLLIGPQGFASSLLLAIPAFVAVGIALATDRGARLSRRELEARTAEAVEQGEWLLARHNAEHYAERRELAQALHGPLQGALTAAEIRIRRASLAGDDQAVAQAAVDVRRALAHVNADSHERLEEVLARITVMWSALCSVEVRASGEVLDEVSRDSTATRALADVISNAVNDAVRHGEATEVVVSLASDDDCVDVTVADNGELRVDRPASGNQGLGSSTLDLVSLSWSRTRTEQGTHLQARIPLRAAAC